MENEKYYMAYEKRYRAVFSAGVERWGHSPEDAALYATLKAWVEEHHLQGRSVIEFACGEGACGVILSTLGCIYHGVDISPSAIERSREALKEYPNATVEVLDMVREQVEGSFDAALDCMGFHMLITDEDRARYLNNAYGVLKENAPMLFFRESYRRDGAYAGAVHSFEEWKQITGEDYQTPQLRQVRSTNGGGVAEVRIPLVPARAKDRCGYVEELEGAGFAVERFEELDPSTAIPCAAGIWVRKKGRASKAEGATKHFCFTVDDNIRFLKEITEHRYGSMFQHPYLAMYRRLHEEFDLKVQLNLFYRMEGFDLSRVSDAYYEEWKANSDWIKLSFHSDCENECPYRGAGYDEVFNDCKRVHEQIQRFASPAALADTTTVHYCLLTSDGVRAMEDNGVCGLLGLFGTPEQPRTSYGIPEDKASLIRDGEILKIGKTAFASIDLVLNCFSTEKILERLSRMSHRDGIRVMIHEQYFYEDYPRYQPDFEEKLRATFDFLTKHKYQSVFYESLLS